MPTDVSILSVGMGANVTPERHISRKEGDMKSPATSSTRKDPIPNQDINRLMTRQDPSISPIIAKYPTGYKPLFIDTHDPNSTEDDPDNYIDNSRNENNDSVNKL